jgi:MraZ protein
MFYGEHEHTIDDKSRLTLPAKYRHALSDGVVLAKGIERSIEVYPRASWDANMARVAELDAFNRASRDMKRFVFTGVAMAELDRQGRVVLPPKLIEHAELAKDVVVLGVHDHVEIWDRAQWAAHLQAIEGSVGDVAERVADRRG